MTSGVSGLVAQSSAMGAIADNITNVNTVGYKNVKTDFQTLVTKQTSATFYSAGGVQAKPLSLNEVQGLLQSTTSQTDIGMSGNGFFVVNESSLPNNNDQYLFTRAGSFFKDEEGYLRNASGFYLQAWPTDSLGNVSLPSGSNATLTNQNIISPDFLQTVNLNRIGGNAAATSEISVGANLPATDPIGAEQKLDIQFFDTLGTTHDVSFRFTKEAPNQWDFTVEPPVGTSSVALYDDTNTGVYKSIGQLEFVDNPTDGMQVEINGIVYEFDSNSALSATGDVAVAIQPELVNTVSRLITAVLTDVDFTSDGAGGTHVIAAKGSNASAVLLTGGDGSAAGIADFNVDISGMFDTNGVPVVRQGEATTSFEVLASTVAGSGIEFNAAGLPAAVNVSKMAVLGFVNGAADMNDVDFEPDGRIDVERIALQFGTTGEANGMTQFGSDFSPTFIQQNGARFGTFAGLTISRDGLMTALYDNGELRPIFKIPVATFVNPNGLGSRTGNAWNATDVSGDPTLRVADSGPAGQIVQASLESSTVDIGEEFTDMIIVQRAYSAATRIISTADEMLDELVRMKR
jgi:flagellar hook protein FlgE